VVTTASDGTRIPRIVHQIWETKQIPEKWKACVESWREHHPGWDYKLWTAEDRESFIADIHPDFLGTYHSYSFAIQRADAARYSILHTYGGVYADLDLECLQPIDDLVDGWSFVLGAEPAEHCLRHKVRLVGNAFIASAGGHPFLAHVIQDLKERDPRNTTCADVMGSTGPLLLTSLLPSYQGSDLCILEPDVLYPFPKDSAELLPLLQREIGYTSVREDLICQGSYAVHYWATAWGQSLAGELENPEPHNVAGYKFYAGFDSVGHDIRNAGRDVRVLARKCDKDRTAVAFNTDGFLKYRVRPRSSWVRIDNPKGNEGFYVKTGWRGALRSVRSVLFRGDRRDTDSQRLPPHYTSEEYTQ
jgi:hypothetical protein